MNTETTTSFPITQSAIFLQILAFLILALVIYVIYGAFKSNKKEQGIVMHTKTVRRSIGAAFILGFILVCYPSSPDGDFGDWKKAGMLLVFISAINYGYARKAERAALAMNAQK